MMHTNAGTPIASVAASRWYLIRAHIIMAALCVAGYYAYALSFAEKTDINGDFIFAIALFVYFSSYTWATLLRPPRITLYNTGLEIPGMDRHPPGKFALHRDGGDLHVYVLMDGQTPSKSRRVLRAHETGPAPDGRSLRIIYKFPWYSARPALDIFMQDAARHMPQSVPKAPPAAVRRPRNDLRALLIYLFISRTGEVTAKATLISILSITFSVLLIMAMLKQDFFPSFQWYGMASIISWILIAAGSLAFYIAFARGKIKLQDGLSRGQRWATLALLPLLLWFFVAIPLTLSLPHLYTLAAGKPVSVERQAYLPKHYDSDHCIEVEGLKTGFLHEFCITRQQYRSLPRNFSIEINGRATWFGMVPKTYRLKPWSKEELSDALKKVAEELEKKSSKDIP